MRGIRRIFPTWDDVKDQKYVFRPLLIPYVILPIWIGLAYIHGDPRRTETPSFEQAKTFADMTTWGLMFIVGGLVTAAVMFISDTLYLRMVLFFSGIMYTWWGVIFALGVAHVPWVSLNAPVLYWFIAYAHFTAAALTRRPEL